MVIETGYIAKSENNLKMYFISKNIDFRSKSFKQKMKILKKFVKKVICIIYINIFLLCCKLQKSAM